MDAKHFTRQQLERMTNMQATEIALEFSRITILLKNNRTLTTTFQITIADDGPTVVVDLPKGQSARILAPLHPVKRQIPVLVNVARVGFHNE